MTEFSQQDLTGSRFFRVDLSDTEFDRVDLSGARFRGSWGQGVVLRGVEFEDVDLDGEIRNFRINGVDVAPLVRAELDRREPERVLMRPTDPAGFRQAWQLIEQRWSETVARARRLPPERLDESVDGEWSFLQTLRHLVFATDSWLRRGVQGEPAPWHPLGLPWEEAPDGLDVPRDLAARPSLDEVLAMRADRMRGMREYLEQLTEEQLAADTVVVDQPGWPPPRSFPVQECLRIVLNEEYQHRRYAERDLAVLEGKIAGA